LGYLTDEHLKWVKGYVYYRFGTKMVSFFIDFNSRPRRLFITPLSPDGKIVSRIKWLEWMIKMWWHKSNKKPLLHPSFWPKVLDLPEWKIIFSRKKGKRGKI
jgi:hypothetical protein